MSAEGRSVMQISLELATHIRAFVAQPARRAESRKHVESLVSTLPAPKNITDPVQDVRAFGAALLALMDRYVQLEEGSASALRATDQMKRVESEIFGLRNQLDAAEKRWKAESEQSSQLREKHRLLELQLARDHVPVGEARKLKDEFLRADEARLTAERRLQQYLMAGEASRDRIAEMENQVAEARAHVAKLEEELKTKDAEIEEARKQRTSTAAEEAKQWFNAQLKALQGENRRLNDLLEGVRKEAEAAKAQIETEAARGKKEMEAVREALSRAETELRSFQGRVEGDFVPKRVLEERESARAWREKELEAKLKEAEARAAAPATAPAAAAEAQARDEEIKRLQNKLIEDRVAYDSWVAQLELSNSQLKEQIRQLREEAKKAAGAGETEGGAAPTGGPKP